MTTAPVGTARAGDTWHLTFRCTDGSPEHYYHFLLGLFVPLVYRLSTDWKNKPFDRFLIRSCGPLDRIIRELGDDRVEIVDKDVHENMVEDGRRRARSGSESGQDAYKFLSIRGCDYQAGYDAAKFAVVRDRLLSLEFVRKAIHAVEDRWPQGSGPRVLLIERGPGLAYYLSADAERKTSGAQRRSIANHEALYQTLRRDFSRCLNVRTEALALAEQIALFSSADVIIAQHGAALANLIWARPTATVVEIFPRTARLEQRARHLFYFLACCVGVRYFKVGQRDKHSDVDVEAVRDVVARAVADRPTPFQSRLRAAAFVPLRIAMSIREAGRDRYLLARARASYVKRRVVARSAAR